MKILYAEYMEDNDDDICVLKNCLGAKIRSPHSRSDKP